MRKINKYVMLSTVLVGVGLSSAVTSEAAMKTTTQSKVKTTIEFAGVNDKTVALGENFNPLNGVSLVSSNGKVNPEAQILISNNTVNVHKAGTYALTYVAFDGTGDYIVKNRKITVKALTDNKPVLNAESQIVFKGSSFNPLSYATAMDKEDGDISKNIKASGTVNTSVSGMYSVNYSITDSAGNTVSKSVNFYVM